MNAYRFFSGSRFRSCFIASLMVGWVMADPSRREGEAFVVGRMGEAVVRVLAGPIHGGRYEEQPVSEGLAFGEKATIRTAPSGEVLLMLEPGGWIALGGGSELTIDRLGFGSGGLPLTATEVHSDVSLILKRGSLRMDATGAPAPVSVTVSTPGGVFSFNGGRIALQAGLDRTWSVTREEGAPAQFIAEGGAVQAIASGKSSRSELNGKAIDALADRAPLLAWRTDMQLLNTQRGSAPAVDRARWAELARADIRYAGMISKALDASPVKPAPTNSTITRPPSDSPQRWNVSEIRSSAASRPPPAPGQAGNSAWTPIEIQAWYDEVGVIKGVNYAPSNVQDPADMFTDENFDLEAFKKDMDLAKKAGYTDIRVQLDIGLWLKDPEGYLQRVAEFVDMVRKKDLRLVITLLDPARMTGKAYTEEELKRFLRTIVRNFRSKDKVLYWDIFSPSELATVDAPTRSLLRKASGWVREAQPEQPITVVALPDENGKYVLGTDIKETDLVTFESFEKPEQVSQIVDILRQASRPVVCTDWLDRKNENTFKAILPIFAAQQVGWFSRGLVNPNAKSAADRSPDQWVNHLFDQDGEPYSGQEIDMIKAFKFEEKQ